MKLKICNTAIAASSIRTYAYEKGAVNAYLKIVDNTKFEDVKNDYSTYIKDNHSIDTDIIFDKDGWMVVNEQVVDEIKNNTFGLNTAPRVIKPVYENNTDKVILNRALDKLRSILPGTNLEILNSKQVAEAYGEKNSKAHGFFTTDNGIVINTDLFTLDTPFHEYSHLVLKYLKLTDKSTYNLIITKALRHHSYKQMRSQYPAMTREAVGEEIFVTQVGLKAAVDFTKKPSVLEKIRGFFRNFIYKVFGVNPVSVNLDESLDNIINKYSKSILNHSNILFGNLTNQQLDAVLNRHKAVSEEDIRKQLIYDGFIKRVAGQDVYLDKHGRRSKEYYSNVKRLGKERALKHYMLTMLKYTNIKYSKINTVKGAIEDAMDRLVIEDKKLTITKDEKKYFNSKTGETTQRSSSFATSGIDGLSDGYVDSFEAERQAERSAKNSKLYEFRLDFENDEIKRGQNKGYKKLSRAEMERQADEYAASTMLEWLKTSPDELKSLTDGFLEIYDTKRELGTFTHELADRGISARAMLQKAKLNDTVYELNSRNKWVEKPRMKTKANGKTGFLIIKPPTGKTVYIFNDANLALYLSQVPIKVKNIKNDKGNVPSDVQNARQGYYSELYSQLRQFEKGKGDMEYFTEIKVTSSKLGMTGTIDLLAVDKSTGEAFVFDHKTKEDATHIERSWNIETRGALKGAFSSYNNNGYTSASIQTSIYRMILTEYGFNTESAGIVLYTKGSFNDAMDEYKNIKVVSKTVGDMREDIVKAYADEGKKIDNVIRTNRDGIHDGMKDIFEGIDADSYEPSDVIIDRYMATVGEQHSKKGDRFFGFLHRKQPIPFPDSIDESDTVAQRKFLSDRFNNKVTLLMGENDIEEFFNNPKDIRSNYKRVKLEEQLQGMTHETHELVRLSKRGDYGDNYAGILLFKNKLTQKHRVIILNADPEHALNILGDNGKHIFSAFTHNIELRRKLIPKTLASSTNINMKLMKVFSVLAKFKSQDPTFAVEYVTSISHDESHKITPYDFNSMAFIAKNLFEYASEAGKLNPELTKLFNTPRIFDSSAYVADTMTQLKAFFDSRNVLRGSYLDAALAVEELIKDPLKNMSKLTKMLEGIYRTGYTGLNTSEKEFINSAILFTQGIYESMVDEDIDALEEYLLTPQKYKARVIQKIKSIAAANMRKASHDMILYHNEHSKAVKEFLEYKTFDNVLQVRTREEYKNLFRPMDVSDPDTLFRLKDESDSSLSAKDITYMRKWKNLLKEAFSHGLEEDSDTAKKRIEEYIDAGYVPLVHKGSLKSFAKSNDKLGAVKKSLEQHQSIGEATADKWQLSASFMSEAFGAPADIQSTIARKIRLGIDKHNVAIEVPAFEMDMEVIMDRIMGEALIAKHASNTLIVGRAITEELKYQELKLDKDNTNLIQVIDTLVRISTKGYTSENQAQKLAGVAGTVATYSTIAFSLSSITIEGITNFANTAKLWVQEPVMSKIFGIKSRFSTNNMVEAAALIATDYEKARAIMLEFGITEPDPMQLKKYLAIDDKNKIFKSENMFGLQALFLSLAQMEVVIASMLKDGSYEAYSVDDSGNLNYNIKKDNRFYGATTGKGKIEQKMFREKLEVMLAREGKTNENGNFFMGYSDLELQAMKDYVVEAFSSMDIDSKNTASFAFFGKLQGKYRTWIIPRVARMLGKSSTGRMVNFKWNYIYADNGDLLDVVPEFGIAEGYLYTIGRTMNALTQATFNDKKMSALSDFEKQQYANALSDVSIVLLLFGIYSLTTCSAESKKEGTCWHDTPYGKIVYNAIKAAPGDVLIILSMWQTATGSQAAMMPGLASLQRSFTSAIAASFYTASGDWEEAKYNAAKVIVAANYVYKMTVFDKKALLAERKAKKEDEKRNK